MKEYQVQATPNGLKLMLKTRYKSIEDKGDKVIISKSYWNRVGVKWKQKGDLLHIKVYQSYPWVYYLIYVIGFLLFYIGTYFLEYVFDSKVESFREDVEYQIENFSRNNFYDI